VKHEKAVYISPKLLTAIQCEAARLERSMSWCVQQAWTIARSRLAGIAAPTPLEQGFESVPAFEPLPYSHARAEAIYAARFDDEEERRVLRLAFPDAILRDMTEEAARLARPFSWVVERAWCLASDEGAGDTMPMARFE